MSKRILIIQGHPDPAGGHLAQALADAYADGARKAGHDLRQVDVAQLDFPLLRSQLDWEKGELPPGLRQAQQDIGWAEHLVIFFPLWLGDMPALLKGFLEQVARPGFAFKYKEQATSFTEKGLTGRSARVVVTMGMPALLYPLVLPCPQREVTRAEHPRLRRHLARARDADRHGGPARRGRRAQVDRPAATARYEG